MRIAIRIWLSRKSVLRCNKMNERKRRNGGLVIQLLQKQLKPQTLYHFHSLLSLSISLSLCLPFSLSLYLALSLTHIYGRTEPSGSVPTYQLMIMFCSLSVFSSTCPTFYSSVGCACPDEATTKKENHHHYIEQRALLHNILPDNLFLVITLSNCAAS